MSHTPLRVMCLVALLSPGAGAQPLRSADAAGEDPASRSVLWDNGDTNGANGVSHLANPRRTVLEDFTIPEGNGWDITGFATVHVWQTLQTPAATGYQLAVWSDDGGRPGAPTAFTGIVALTETPTGRVWLGRPEMRIEVSMSPLHLEPGTYWLEMHVIGPENCLQLVHDRAGHAKPCWVNYSDVGGLRDGREVFYLDYDVSFQILGEPTGCGFADVNGDGAVDTLDFLAYLALWAARDPRAECVGDIGIDTQDFLCFLTAWSQGC